MAIATRFVKMVKRISAYVVSNAITNSMLFIILFANSMKKLRKTINQKTRKRKLTLDEIGKCNPGTRSNRKCLPDNFYTNLGKSDPFKSFGCGDGEEHCLLDKAPISDILKTDYRTRYLRPRRPEKWDADPDMWLDNFNIEHVMRQYEKAVPWFHFLGIFPIDFSAPDPYKKDGPKQCLYKETCDLKLMDEYNKGVRGIGLIFNLDPHYKGGSHWVGLYINLMDKNKPFVGYFDSYGYAVPPLIARLMRSFKLQVKSCKLGYNARRYQYGNSECGMFSLYFIICMIHGIRFKDFCKDSVNDQYMLDLRKVLFVK
jgi:hypothetical protein